MFSDLKHGWVYVDMNGYGADFSYSAHIPRDWLAQAILGLEKDLPITVYGDCEPGRCIFTITETSCHAFYEDEADRPASKRRSSFYIQPMGKMEFCKKLYTGILENLDEWAAWLQYSYKTENKDYPYDDPKFIANKKELEEKLQQLKELIDLREKKEKGV